MDAIPFERFAGSAVAFGRYGRPTAWSIGVPKMLLLILAIAGALVALYAIGAFDGATAGTLLGVSLVAVQKGKLDGLIAEREEILKKAEKAGDFTIDGEDMRERLDALDKELIPQAEADYSRAADQRVRTVTTAALPDDDEGPLTPIGQPSPEAMTMAEAFLGSEDWKAYLKSHAKGGSFPSSPNSQVQSPKVLVGESVIERILGRGPESYARRFRALVTGTSTTSAGAAVIPGQSGIFDPGATQREITVLDLLTRGTTDSDAVEYVRVTGFTNNAAPVQEAEAILAADETPASVSVKPWSDLALLRVNEPVKTIAHGVPATKRALGDAGQMRVLIDNFLRYGLQEELVDQVISGSGTGENLEGIATVSGTGTQAYDTSRVLTLRKAKTKVRTEGRARPNGFAMNPTDVDNLYAECLASTAPGMAAILMELAQGRIHGLPIAEDEAIPVGTAWVAAWNLAVLWDRQQTTIEATSGYMDFFMRNLVAILAEMRVAFGVIRPAAFIEADVTP